MSPEGASEDGAQAESQDARAPKAASEIVAPILAGRLQRGQPLSIELEGPFRRENPETFRNYRLMARFRHEASGVEAVAPGAFVADGAAAESGAASGAMWAVRFTPALAGVWRYEISFRAGRDVAVNAADVGAPAPAADGAVGRFRAELAASAASESADADATDGFSFPATGRRVANRLLFGCESALGLNGADPADAERIDVLGASAARVGGVVRLALIGPASPDDAWNSPWMAADLREAFEAWRAEPSDERRSALQTRMRIFDVSKLESWNAAIARLQALGVVVGLDLNPSWPTSDGWPGFWSDPEFALERRLLLREMTARFAHHDMVWIAPIESDDAAFLAALDPYGRPLWRPPISESLSVSPEPPIAVAPAPAPDRANPSVVDVSPSAALDAPPSEDPQSAADPPSPPAPDPPAEPALDLALLRIHPDAPDFGVEADDGAGALDFSSFASGEASLVAHLKGAGADRAVAVALSVAEVETGAALAPARREPFDGFALFEDLSEVAAAVGAAAARIEARFDAFDDAGETLASWRFAAGRFRANTPLAALQGLELVDAPTNRLVAVLAPGDVLDQALFAERSATLRVRVAALESESAASAAISVERIRLTMEAGGARRRGEHRPQKIDGEWTAHFYASALAIGETTLIVEAFGPAGADAADGALLLRVERRITVV